MRRINNLPPSQNTAHLQAPGGTQVSRTQLQDLATIMREATAQFMEANHHSNAAPPASAKAIGKLEKKPLDEKMMGNHREVECTICMDELCKSDEVTILPCQHWFHPKCVNTWRTEHNTCPLCRSSIEERSSQLGLNPLNTAGLVQQDVGGPSTEPRIVEQADNHGQSQSFRLDLEPHRGWRRGWRKWR